MFLLLLCTVAGLAAKAQAPVTFSKSPDTLRVKNQSVVPPGAVYYIKNKQGVLLESVTAGKKINLYKGTTATNKMKTAAAAADLDCVKIPCPEGWKPTTVCWECKERPTSSAVNRANIKVAQ